METLSKKAQQKLDRDYAIEQLLTHYSIDCDSLTSSLLVRVAYIIKLSL